MRWTFDPHKTVQNTTNNALILSSSASVRTASLNIINKGLSRKQQATQRKEFIEQTVLQNEWKNKLRRGGLGLVSSFQHRSRRSDYGLSRHCKLGGFNRSRVWLVWVKTKFMRWLWCLLWGEWICSKCSVLRMWRWWRGCAKSYPST